MKNTLLLGTLLTLFWLGLSGLYTVFILVLGLLSILLVLWLNHRMQITDNEILPLKLLIKLPKYWYWLFFQIIKANLHVVKKIWQPTLDIQPQFSTVASPYKHNMTRVIQANSITLTPGTITVCINNNELLVHSLTDKTKQDLHDPAMDIQIKQLENSL